MDTSSIQRSTSCHRSQWDCGWRKKTQRSISHGCHWSQSCWFYRSLTLICLPILNQIMTMLMIWSSINFRFEEISQKLDLPIQNSWQSSADWYISGHYIEKSSNHQLHVQFLGTHIMMRRYDDEALDEIWFDLFLVENGKYVVHKILPNRQSILIILNLLVIKHVKTIRKLVSVTMNQ